MNPRLPRLRRKVFPAHAGMIRVSQSNVGRRNRSGIVHWKPAPNLAKSCRKARRVKHGNGAPDGENKLAIQAFPTHPQFLSPRGTHCPWVSPDGDMMNST